MEKLITLKGVIKLVPEKQENFISIVTKYIEEHTEVEPTDIEMVSYTWTLGNLKAVFTIIGKNENDYYEATYNVSSDEIYLVTYNKTGKVVL